MEFDLIPQGTLLQENGHGEAVDIRSSDAHFLLHHADS